MFVTKRAVYEIETGRLLELEGFFYEGPIAEAKGQGNATKQLGITNDAAAQAGQNAQSIYSSLNPQLQSEATNPQGYSPADLNSMRTGARQAAGGATAGITGQGNLMAARTRNAAGLTGALDQAARSEQQTNSSDELAIEAANANLKQQQQQAGLAGLSGLFGQETGSQNQLYGLGPGTLQAQASLQNSNPFLQFMSSLGNSAATGAGLAMGCWVAQAVYGENDPRWKAFRNEFIRRADRSTPYRFALALYVAIGPYVAMLVKRSKLLKKAFKSLFDRLL